MNTNCSQSSVNKKHGTLTSNAPLLLGTHFGPVQEELIMMQTIAVTMHLEVSIGYLARFAVKQLGLPADPDDLKH